MRRATRYRYVGPQMTAYALCPHCCGGAITIWTEHPNPGHNIGTLYECGGCGAVISLGDKHGDLLELLP